MFSQNKKGLFFIIDLVLAVAVIILVLFYVSSTMPTKPVLFAEDMVFAEANYFMNAQTYKIKQITVTENSLCRNIETLFFEKGVQTMLAFKSDFCVSIIK